MGKQVIVHMLPDSRDGIEGLVEALEHFPPPRIAGALQDDIVSLTLSWNRGQNRCGPFKINVGHLADGENHFQLVISEDIPVPIPGALSRIFPPLVGLQWLTTGNGKTCWGNAGDQPCPVTGAGTPWPEPIARAMARHQAPQHPSPDVPHEGRG